MTHSGEQQTKRCPKCKEDKDVSLFGKRSGDKLRTYCKSCAVQDKNQRTKRYRESFVAPSNKICRKCQDDLPISNFTKISTAKDGHNSMCKKCQLHQRREALRAQGKLNDNRSCAVCGKERPNWQVNQTRLHNKCLYRCDECKKEAVRANCATNKQYVADMKVQIGKCLGCDERNPLLLKFVLSGKNEVYSDIAICQWKHQKVQAEIGKAQLLCKCCRIMKKDKPPKVFKSSTWRKDRNDAYVKERKLQLGACVQCSRRVSPETVRVFHFHNRTTGDKCLCTTNTSASASLETLKHNIDECELLCANCGTVRKLDRSTSDNPCA